MNAGPTRGEPLLRADGLSFSYPARPVFTHWSAHFTAGLTCVERLEVLPFHQLGREKWLATGEPYLLENTRSPSPELIERVKGQFAEYGINVM